MTPLGLIIIAALTLYIYLVKGVVRTVFHRTDDDGPLVRAIVRASTFALFFGFGGLGVEGFGLPVPSLLGLLIAPWWGHGMLELNLKGLAFSWVVFLVVFLFREFIAERRNATSNRRYSGGPVSRKKQPFDLGSALAAISILIVLGFIGLLFVLFGVDFATYLGLLLIAILLDSVFVAWFRRLRRGQYKVTVETPGLVCFETDFGQFQINKAHSSFRFSGENQGAWSLDDIRDIEFEATQRWSVIGELILGWDPTDVVEENRDRLEYFLITLSTKDGRNVPLYIASQLRPREFLMNWYIRMQEIILGRLRLFTDGYRHSRSAYLNLIKHLRAAGVLLPDAITALPIDPPQSMPKTRQTYLR